MKEKILLIGAGGHCKVVLDVLSSHKEYEVVGIVDFKDKVGSKVLGIPVIGTDSDMPRLFKAGIKNCFISVGSIGNPQPRMKLCNIAKKIGFASPNLISSQAVISISVILGHGNYIAPGTIVNAGARIGNHCIINTGAIIEHDCMIGDFVHVSPGAILNGNVKVADCAHIGAGSTVIQNLEVGFNAIVGAGSVVIKNVRKNTVVYGNPCRERKTNA